MEQIVISGLARTAIGTFGGSLKDIPEHELGAVAVRAALSRAGVTPDQVDEVVLGCVGGQIGAGAYIARHVARTAGLPVQSTAQTVNRLCGSGLQAVNTAAGLVALGEARVAVAGGLESMSRLPYVARGMRWGTRMGDSPLTDIITEVLSDPFHRYHMGVTAENLAERYGISRADQDHFALVSQQRAAAGIAAGKFRDEIVPVTVPAGRGQTREFAEDEHVRGETTIEGLGKLKTVFKSGGTVTAGNASGINDAAAAMVVTTAATARELGLKPQLEVVGYAVAGVDPAIMGIGPVPAIRKVLAKTGLSLQEIDLIELNEAFAAQSLTVIRDLDLDTDRVNVLGGAIAHGHPVGATGALLTVKLAHELARRAGRYGLVSLCIGGGQGIATIFRRLA